MHVLVMYHSRTGNTKALAEHIAEGVRSVEEVDCIVKSVADVEMEDLFAADGIIAGSPSYYGVMASELKVVFDRIFNDRPKMTDKVGAAFSTAGHPTGGIETTMISILESMLVAGMIVVSDPPQAGGHFGVGCAGKPDERVERWARMHGERVANLVKQLGVDQKEGARA